MAAGAIRHQRGICDVGANFANATSSTTWPALPTTYYPRFMRYVQGELGKTERLGLTGSLQWASDDRHQGHAGRLFSRYKVSRNDWPLEAIGFSRGASQGGKPEMVVRDMILDSNNTMQSTACSTTSTCARSTICDEFSTDFTAVDPERRARSSATSSA
jgi:iron complex outermembrane receptor protein